MKPILCSLFLPLLPLASAQWGSGSGTGSGSGSGSGSSSSSSSGSTGDSSSSGTHVVDVGKIPYTYEPDTLTVAPGEKVEFHFYPKNHSVVQAAFDNPCQPMSQTSFFSGFMPTASESSTIFTLTVNDTKPIWFYCPQVVPFDHCQTGMVGVINPPTSGPDTLSAFKMAASKVTGSSEPAAIQGGVLSTEKSTSTNSTSSSASGTPTPSPTSANAAGKLRLFTDIGIISIFTFLGVIFLM